MAYVAITLSSCACTNSDPAGTLGVIRTLNEIHGAENVFRQRFGRFGTSDELKHVRQSDLVLRAKHEPFGFRFDLKMTQNGYEVVAYATTEYTRTFFMDETGIVRHARGARKADAKSPILD